MSNHITEYVPRQQRRPIGEADFTTKAELEQVPFVARRIDPWASDRVFKGLVRVGRMLLSTWAAEPLQRHLLGYLRDPNVDGLPEGYPITDEEKAHWNYYDDTVKYELGYTTAE